MAAPQGPGRQGAAAPPARQRMSLGTFLLIMVPLCVVGFASAKLSDAVQFAPAGTKFAYAGVTLGLSALAALGLAFLVRVPDFWWRRGAAITLGCLVGLQPVFGMFVLVDALEQALRVSKPDRGLVGMVGVILLFFWGMALMLPVYFAAQRRNRPR